jgi:hypothetical protein
MATIAATTIREATVKEAEEDTKAFNRRNAMSATKQDAGLTSIPWTSEGRYTASSVSMLSTQQIRMPHYNTTRLSSVSTKESRD